MHFRHFGFTDKIILCVLFSILSAILPFVLILLLLYNIYPIYITYSFYIIPTIPYIFFHSISFFFHSLFYPPFSYFHSVLHLHTFYLWGLGGRGPHCPPPVPRPLLGGGRNRKSKRLSPQRSWVQFSSRTRKTFM